MTDNQTPDSPQDSPKRGGRTAMIVALVALAVTAAMLVPQVLAGDDDGSRVSSSRSSTSATEESGQAADHRDALDALSALARREPGDPTAIGETDAPVVMLAYSDFQCPFCGRHARETEPKLVEQFVDDGTLRIEWRDFPYLGEDSKTAAHAGRAAAKQNKFWDYYEVLFAHQPTPNSGALDEQYLTEKAEEAGLDVQRFTEDMGSQDVAHAVERDFQEGLSIGVNGTPTFLINGQPIIGAQPLDIFVDAVEKAAAEAE